ncbi:MAG: PaaI family thioesterase [Gammaproteobacteria bacterium]
MSAIPEGFEAMPPFGPFHELVGPIYARRTQAGWIVGFPVQEKHRNRGTALHGGMLCMLADTAFTWASHYSREPPIRCVTTSLAVNFVGRAAPGDWVEAHVDVVRSGRTAVFMNLMIWCRGERIAQATAQFQVVGQADG